jgi:hypothetical protein
MGDLDQTPSGIPVQAVYGFHHPVSMDPAVRARVESACKAWGTSIHSTGSSPGFITEALPIVLASVQRRLTSLTINEYADLSRRDSPDLLFNIMGSASRRSTSTPPTVPSTPSRTWSPPNQASVPPPTPPDHRDPGRSGAMTGLSDVGAG